MSQFLLSATINKIMSYTIANLTPVQHRVLTSFYQLTKELQNGPPQKLMEWLPLTIIKNGNCQ